MSDAAHDMSPLARSSFFHGLLAHGVSGEIVQTDAGGLLLVVDYARQVEAARAAVAAYFPEVVRVTAHGLGCCG